MKKDNKLINKIIVLIIASLLFVAMTCEISATTTLTTSYQLIHEDCGGGSNNVCEGTMAKISSYNSDGSINVKIKVYTSANRWTYWTNDFEVYLDGNYLGKIYTYDNHDEYINYCESDSFLIQVSSGYHTISTKAVDFFRKAVATSQINMGVYVDAPKILSYNGNGNTGGSVSSNATGIYNYLTVSGNGFTRTGYTFNRWNLLSDGSSTNYYPGNSIYMDANKTLYAIWSANTYTVYLDPNGGKFNDGGTSAKSFSETYDSSVNRYLSSYKPTKDNNIFLGFYTSGGTKVYDASCSYTNDGTYFKNGVYHYAGNLYLYAKWEDYPSITISSYSPALRKSDGSINYTNSDVTVNIYLKDNESGLSALYLEKGSSRTLITSSINGLKETTYSYKVSSNIYDSDNYYLVIKDKYGLESKAKLVVDNIDKVKPEINNDKTSLKCDAVYTDDDKLTIALNDNYSGLDYWTYVINYQNSWGENRTYNSGRINSSSVNLDLDSPIDASIIVTAYDKAGNSYASGSCGFVTASKLETSVGLIDYEYLFARYDEMFGRGSDVTESIATSYIGFLEADENAASKSCLVWLKDKVKNEGMSKAEALALFMETYGYEK